MQFDLSGKTAFVTGATSGLGVHFSRILASSGASVAIASRRVERLESLRKDIGARCSSIALDVTDAAQIAPALNQAEAALGPIDILVNNAGLSANGPVTDIAVAGYDAVMATNLRGPFLLAQELGRRLIARKKGGRIINIASITAFRVLPGSAVYCMSKAALAMMTQCMAREWARYDINVNAIAPGFIETELNSEWFASPKGLAQINSFPKRRLQQARDLDGTLLLLASEASRGITGSIFTVDEGQSL